MHNPFQKGAPLKVLVTGAAGRIGSHLSRGLLAEGHTVRAFGLAGDPGLARLADAGAQVFEGDLEAPDDLVPAVSGIDVICHLGAALTTHDASDDRFVDVNLRGTFNVLEAARQHAPGIKRFVYTSSDAVYLSGDDDHAEIIDEAHPQRPGTVYGATKVGAELLSRSFWKTYGIPITVMRPTATANPGEFVRPDSVFGRRWFVSAAADWLTTHPREAAGSPGLLDELRAAGKDKLYVLTGPDGVAGTVTYGDARDAAAGMRAMLENDAAIGEAFNIGPAAPVSELDFTEHLGARLGLDVVVIKQDKPRRQWRISSKKAQTMLGYQPLRDPLGMIDEAAAGLAVTEGRTA
jgi:nucleoside-diphosphate-sugar epimerase